MIPTDPRRILLVGQGPSRRSDPDRPLVGGRSGLRIQTLAAVDLRGYVRLFDRVQLLDRWLGKRGRGDAIDAEAMRSAAETVLARERHRRIICVGRATARACGLDDDWPYLRWASWMGVGEQVEPERLIAVLPHPSGINRWWNEPANVAEARRFLEDAVAEAKRRMRGEVLA